MDDERLFQKLSLKQMFMHPRKMSMEAMSESSQDKDRVRNDSLEELGVKGSWQKLLKTSTDG